MIKTIVCTDGAPRAMGTYSQAVKVGQTVYISGQYPVAPGTSELIAGDIEAQIRQVFDNLAAVAAGAGGGLADLVKVTLYLTDLDHFPLVNRIMGEYLAEPYPARNVIGAAALPKAASVGADAIMVLEGQA
jgi:reactive intermediate/imine deaminase